MVKHFYGFASADNPTFMLQVCLEDIVAYGADIDTDRQVTTLWLRGGQALRVSSGLPAVNKALQTAGLWKPDP